MYMKTLIELYDERPFENVLSTEAFRPEHTIFIIPNEIKEDYALQNQLRNYFKHRNLSVTVSFVATDMYQSHLVYEKLEEIIKHNENVMIDITGGTDAALFATGKIANDYPVSVVTYSRRKNKFFNIQNAEFADEMACIVQYKVESFLRMAGGAMRQGRVDNNILKNYLDVIDPFFQVYLKHRNQWVRTITYLQNASYAETEQQISLMVNAPKSLRVERSKYSPDMELLQALEDIGFIHDLRESKTHLSFEFHDRQIRTWLRDIGSVLELYIYKACLDTGIFNDVRCSVIADWEGTLQQTDVTNEIDVMASRGVTPIFISCKTNQIKTEALNELSVIRDRFGGLMAHAIIVSSTKGGAMMKRRAMELNIHVIDLETLKNGDIRKALIAASTSYDQVKYYSR